MAAKREHRLRKSERKIGIALLQARVHVRMSQGELGRKCGAAVRTMSRWENGFRVPNAEQTLAIVRALLEIDEEAAEHVAVAAGSSLERLGLAEPPTPPSPPARVPPSKEAIELAMYGAAEEIDVPPARLRAPLVKLFAKLAALGATWEEASSAITPPARAKSSR
jgi:transcriptional regulator with XRE-family HTH domain